MSIDCLKDAEHWRERAEQIRTKAEAMCDQAVKRQMTFAHAPAGRGQTDAIARLRQADRDRGRCWARACGASKCGLLLPQAGDGGDLHHLDGDVDRVAVPLLPLGPLGTGLCSWA